MDKLEAIPRDSTTASQRIEIIAGHERRRAYSDAEKVRLLAEASEPGARIHDVARRHGLCSSLLYRWRRQGVGVQDAAAPLIPVRVATEDCAVTTPIGAVPRGAAPLIEIALPNGCVVRVDQQVDARALRRILTALRG